MDDVLGLHLVAHLDLVSSPRRSVLARLDASGRLRTLETADADAAIIALVDAHEASMVVVDAPLAVPNASGRRDVEAVLAWCDITAFPVSARRMETVFAGARGVGLAGALGRGGRRTVEALPDQVLREIAWEAGHPGDAPAMDLALYRAAWLGVRAPRYRPKGAGRARPDGVLAAWQLLGSVVDMGGWAPGAAPDDWAAIADSARVDAICCAYAGLRVVQGTGVCLGASESGTIALPVDANLRGRLAATLERLRSAGEVAI
jgi:predicted nuclease with RNAse H fold